MKTDDLIKALNADADSKSMSLGTIWLAAGSLAIVLAASMFFMMIGPRGDIADAAGTMRFLFKFVVTLALAGTGFALLDSLARPGASTRSTGRLLLLAPLMLGAAVLLEMALVPAGDWGRLWIGTNRTVCLTFIPLIGLGPLAVFLYALRQAAPTRPGLAGAVAGILAGGIAATFYAAHCTDDSPLFVATWYTVAIAGLAVLGALLSRAFVRW